MGGKRVEDREVVGLKFNLLEVVARHGVDSRNHTLWLCNCECGNTTTAELITLRSGRKKSCGCLKVAHQQSGSIKHGAKKVGADPALRRTFDIWAGMRKRCNNPKDRAYKWYGARGVTMSKEWDSFEQFVIDMGVAPDGLTIERLDVYKGYSKDNCKWVPLNRQAGNKTTTLWVTYEGVRWCLKYLCGHLGLPYMRTYKRYVTRGWPLGRALGITE